MAKHLKPKPMKLKEFPTADERIAPNDIEMTEITGGTFWKAYTTGQIAGTEEFKASGSLDGVTAMAGRYSG